MLKYSVKLDTSNIEKKELVWKEKYLSPDLSSVSGVCDIDYHLEKYSQLAVSSELNNSAASVGVDSSIFKRKGYVLFKNLKFKESSAKCVTYKNNLPITHDYTYITINGKYFYYVKGSGYTINNVLHYDYVADSISDSTFTVQPSNGYVSFDYISYIDDNTVTVQDYSLTYDITTNSLLWNDNFVTNKDILCDEIDITLYETKNWKDYIKFTLTKLSDYDAYSHESLSYCKPYYYIEYKDTICYIDTVSSKTDTNFYCYIPKGLLSSKHSIDINDYESSTEYAAAQELSACTLCFVTGTTVYDINDYVSRFNELGIAEFDLTVKNLNQHNIYNVYDLYSLNNINSFVKIDGYYYLVQSDITNANDGKNIIFTLEDDKNGVDSGDLVIASIMSSDDNILLPVYSAQTEFVIHEGDKYQIEPNLCDKLVMLGSEYEINYINGKKANEICLVTIDEDEIPMLIVSTDDGIYSGGTLKRLGEVITSTSAATESVYDIHPYDGVTIKGNKYQRYDNSICITDDLNIELVIKQSRGSSTFICKPLISENLLSNELRNTIETDLCKLIIDNNDKCTIYLKNKIFGNSPIASDLPFAKTDEPLSSDDYYSLFDDLKVYVNMNYITLPLSFSYDSGGYALQDDLIESEFYEAEKKKAINAIVDMEKDVYVPKFIPNKAKYKGCETVFDNIQEIDFNLHFRTRDLDSWKINEGTTNYSTSGRTDNWFVTDIHPYKDMLTENKNQDKLMETSDLLGLLYFTNDDVFYQRKKISKTFLRLSFYDSTDEQTQSLLATSTVFMDERALYKKFIDNSRKNVYAYGNVALPEYSANTKGYIASSYTDIAETVISNKINVSTEFMQEKKDSKKSGMDWSQMNNYIKFDSDTYKRRLDSRFVIKNKYETESSSEGFYIYMFKDYATSLHPRQVFMKVEFNHAGVGKTLDFQVPMKWEKEKNSSLYFYPKEKYTLKNNLQELKSGITLEMKAAQSYIPLYAVYDFKHKEYAYVFDSRYVEVKDGVAKLNLFEPKYRDESGDLDQDTRKEIQKKITNGKTDKYAININTNQFELKYFI